jgi:hypothetical protein
MDQGRRIVSVYARQGATVRSGLSRRMDACERLGKFFILVKLLSIRLRHTKILEQYFQAGVIFMREGNQIRGNFVARAVRVPLNHG